MGIKYRLDQALIQARYAGNGLSGYLQLGNDRNSAWPSIAAVMVGRNDDYMPDFAERLRITLEWNIRHFVVEPILVEWNPLEERELLGTKLVRLFPS